MKQKIVAVSLAIISLCCLIDAFYVSRKAIIKKTATEVEREEEKTSSGWYRYPEKPDLRYGDFMPYFHGQGDEYQKVIEEFSNNKEIFKEIIAEINKIDYGNDISSFYFLGEKWKKDLKYIPDSDFLETYKGDFLIFFNNLEAANNFSIGMNESLQQFSNENPQLKSQLDYLSKSEIVEEIVIQEDIIWFKLIGPFFKERIMVYLGYFHKGREGTPPIKPKKAFRSASFEEKYREDMWLDEHWMIVIPYPASEDEEFDPYPVMY